MMSIPHRITFEDSNFCKIWHQLVGLVSIVMDGHEETNECLIST
jgi:hypothetical protein